MPRLHHIALLCLALFIPGCKITNNIEKKVVCWQTPPHQLHAVKATAVYQAARLPFTHWFWKHKKLPAQDEEGMTYLEAVNEWRFVKSKEVAWGPTYCYLVYFSDKQQPPCLLEVNDFTMPWTVGVATLQRNGLGLWSISAWYSKDRQRLRVPVKPKKS
jgi:hypothetical protein